MDELYIYVGLGLIGLCLGSFAAATVWRLRAKQLVEDKRGGEKVKKSEYKELLPLADAGVMNDYSRCLHCQHRLAWYDLIPLISWLQIKGKCRYCHQPIGWLEPAAELGLGLFFVASYWVWPVMLDNPLAITQFIIWLTAGVMLTILTIYDLKWFLLPNSVVFPLIGLGCISAVLHLSPFTVGIDPLLSLLGAIGILSGVYLVLWLISKGAWIGFGDVKLGLGLALILGQWELAFIALFAANIIGCLVVIPGMVTGKIQRSTRVPFGPLLIAGYGIAGLWGMKIADYYFALSF